MVTDDVDFEVRVLPVEGVTMAFVFNSEGLRGECGLEFRFNLSCCNERSDIDLSLRKKPKRN
jgi:hypothetical protein